jgi:hypothetical protein
MGLLSPSTQLFRLLNTVIIYPLSAYEVMNVLGYYLNLYARLNNVVITIYKLK